LYSFFTGFPAFKGGSEYLIFQDMLKHTPEYYDFLFTEEETKLLSSMIQREKDQRITIEKVLSFFETSREMHYSSSGGLIDATNTPIPPHPEDKVIMDMLKFFEEFDSYEDIEINYQTEECLKRVKADPSLSEESKRRLEERLKLVKKQLYHKFNHKEFEYSRGPMVIDDIE
jgi:hypothetical protein